MGQQPNQNPNQGGQQDQPGQSEEWKKKQQQQEEERRRQQQGGQDMPGKQQGHDKDRQGGQG